jgi:hypothetical protein
LRGRGDDFWHVKIILAPWIPGRAQLWLTTPVWWPMHYGFFLGLKKDEIKEFSI